MKKSVISIIGLLLILFVIGEFGVFLLTAPQYPLNTAVKVERLYVSEELMKQEGLATNLSNHTINGITETGEYMSLQFHTQYKELK